MIGFFQNTMAKHHRIVFGSLLAVIVVAFVAYTGSGSAADIFIGGRYPKIYGVTLDGNSDKVYRAAVRLQYGNIGNEETFRNVLINRIFLVHFVDTYQIQYPTEKEFSTYVESMPYFLKDGKFDPQAFIALCNNLNVTEAELNEILVQNWRIDRVVAILSSGITALPEEVNLYWQDISTTWKLETATYPRSSFKFDKKPTEAELKSFYEQNKENYRINELLKFSYAIVSPSEEIKASIPKVSDSDLLDFIKANKPNTETKTPEELLKTDRDTYLTKWKNDYLGTSSAAKLSDQLVDSLPIDDVLTDKDLEAAIKKSGLSFQEIPAFPRGSLPVVKAVSSDILKYAEDTLTSTLWRSDAIPMGDKAIVLLFNGTLPSRIPDLKEVEKNVLEDWKKDNEQRAYFEKTKELGEKIKTGLTAGKSFANTAKDLGLIVKPEFAISNKNRPEGMSVNTIAQLVSEMKLVKLKELTNPILDGKDFVFAYPVVKNVPSVDVNNEELKNVNSYLQTSESRSALEAQLMYEYTKVALPFSKTNEEEIAE